MNTGNQHVSMKRNMMDLIHAARSALSSDMLRHVRVSLAQSYLALWGARMASVPASTRRRWKCGR